MNLWICEPVGPFSRRHELDAWLEHLDQLEREYAGHEQPLAAIRRNRERVLEWIKWQEAEGIDRLP